MQERVYKCLTCANLFHLSCQQKSGDPTIPKRVFRCDNCSNKPKPKRSTPPTANNKQQKPNSGFAGFSEQDRSDATNEDSTATANCTTSSYEEEIDHRVDDNSLSAENTVEDAMGLTAHIKTPPDSPESAQGTHIDNGGDSKCSSDSEYDDYAVEVARKHKLKEEMPLPKSVIDTTVNVPDVRHWDCDEIFTYFMGATTAEFAQLLKEREIDGDALMLINREDVLTKFNLKLGPALRLYSHIVTLQFKNNNPVLAWEED